MSGSSTEIFTNDAQTTTTGSSGTTSPAGGTVETWTVTSSASFPAASSLSVTSFHIADPALTSEIIQVTNVSGTTWTVVRGAESTTPVAHATGATFNQVVTAGFLAKLSQTAPIQPSGDTSGATDTALIQAAVNSTTAGIVVLGMGQFYTNAQITVPHKVRLMGSGPATYITPTSGLASGQAVFWMHDTVVGDASNAVLNASGGISDMQIDGTNASAGAIGVDIGDGWGYRLDHLFITHFNGAGSIGLNIINRYFYTEKMRATAIVIRDCTTCAICDTALQTHLSHEYNDLEFYISTQAGQNAVVVQNGVTLQRGSLFIRGNYNNTSTSNAVLTIGNSAEVGAGNFADINDQRVEITGETNSPGAGPVTINFVNSSDKMTNCYGIICLTGVFANSNAVSGQFTFGGPIRTDTQLTAINAKPAGWL